MQNSSGSGRSGQAMIIAVLSLSGAILGATAIAGFLTLYTIRSVTDYRDSAQAIFTADTGVNWLLYNELNGFSDPTLPAIPADNTLTVTCYDDTGAKLASCNGPAAAAAVSEGTTNSSRRAFSIDLAGATSTVP